MQHIDYLETPIGLLEISATSKGISSVYFVDKVQATRPNDVTNRAKRQLNEYLDNGRRSFDLPLDTSGTDFQCSVWKALEGIDYGETRSYQDIANEIKNPKSVRAVGAANGKNPVSIIVPCHRVIGANGSLTGYAGGVDRKEWLLKHEGALLL